MRVPLPAAMITTSTMPTPAAMFDSRSLRLPWVRIIGLLFMALTLVSIGACSAVKLAYNNLPDISYWWLDAYVDLNEPQTLQVRSELSQLHQWHRETELVKLADLLRKVQQLTPADTTAEQLCAIYADVRERFEAVARRVEPAAAALALQLEPSQIKHMQAHFDKGNAEWRRDWAKGDRAERREKRLKSAIERAEQFYGTLDERQRAVLGDAIYESRFDPQRSYAERVRRQQDLLQTLRELRPSNGAERVSVAAAGAALRGYLDRAMRSPDPAYRVYADNTTLDTCRTYARLHNSTSAQQRTRARSRLAAYERDARELAAPAS